MQRSRRLRCRRSWAACAHWTMTGTCSTASSRSSRRSRRRPLAGSHPATRRGRELCRVVAELSRLLRRPVQLGAVIAPYHVIAAVPVVHQTLIVEPCDELLLGI